MHVGWVESLPPGLEFPHMESGLRPRSPGEKSGGNHCLNCLLTGLRYCIGQSGERESDSVWLDMTFSFSRIRATRWAVVLSA